MKLVAIALAGVIGVTSLAGCTSTRAERGALIGGTTGAVIGGVASERRRRHRRRRGRRRGRLLIAKNSTSAGGPTSSARSNVNLLPVRPGLFTRQPRPCRGRLFFPSGA